MEEHKLENQYPMLYIPCEAGQEEETKNDMKDQKVQFVKQMECEDQDDQRQDEPKKKVKQQNQTEYETQLPPMYQSQLVDDISIQKAMANHFEQQSLAGMLISLEQQKVTMFIKAHYDDGLTYTNYFLRINNQHFYLKKPLKQSFCINKQNGDLYVYTPGNLNFIYHFIITSKNEMTCINILALNKLDDNFQKPILYFLQEPNGQDDLILIIENWQMLIIDAKKHIKIGTLKLANKRFRPIIYQDAQALYLIAGKGSTSSASKYFLSQIFNNRAILSIKSVEIPIKYLNWGITQSSLHDAAICHTTNGLYIIGRRQYKTLEVQIDQNKNEMRIKYAPQGFLAIQEQVFLVQENVASLKSGQIIYFSDDISKEIFKTLKI